MGTARQQMTQAVLEGVAFAIRDCVEIARRQGIRLQTSTLCGGGAKSRIWRTSLANVLKMTLELPQTEQGPGLGGAMLAGVACGIYPDVKTCARQLVHIREKIRPDPALTAKYEKRYVQWHRMYPALRCLEDPECSGGFTE